MKSLILIVAFQICIAFQSSGQQKLRLQDWCTSGQFEIHGLWYNLSPSSFKDNCGGASFVDVSGNLLDEMNSQWQTCDNSHNRRTGKEAQSFQEHEWTKHGTCFKGMTEQSYFQKAMDLFKALFSVDCKPGDQNCEFCYDLSQKRIDCPTSTDKLNMRNPA